MEISFCSHPNINRVIATTFGTWHDSWTVVACAKFCRDMIISNWIRAKWNFHRIWIVMEKSLVKWVPDMFKSEHDMHHIVLMHNEAELCNLQANFRSGRWRTMHCRESTHGSWGNPMQISPKKDIEFVPKPYSLEQKQILILFYKRWQQSFNNCVF